MSRFDPRWILGKTVAAVEMNPSTGHGLGVGTLHEPVIRFTDGSSIALVAVEGEDMDGVDIIYTSKVRARLAARKARQLADAQWKSAED